MYQIFIFKELGTSMTNHVIGISLFLICPVNHFLSENSNKVERKKIIQVFLTHINNPQQCVSKSTSDLLQRVGGGDKGWQMSEKNMKRELHINFRNWRYRLVSFLTVKSACIFKTVCYIFTRLMQFCIS